MNIHPYFSFTRISWIIKRDLIENWKKLSLLFLTFFIIYFGILFIYLNLYECFPSPNRNNFIQAITGAYLFVIQATIYIGASFILQNMQTKQMRSSYLMLPASPQEKFITRTLYVTIGLMIMLILGSLFAEALFWCVNPFDTLPEEFFTWIWPEVWSKILTISTPQSTISLNIAINSSIETHSLHGQTYGPISVIVMIIWIHSVYILGGCHWYKWAWVKTTIILALITLIYDSVFSEKQLDANHDMVLTYIIGFLTLFNWWLSYRLFTRYQIIKNKSQLI